LLGFALEGQLCHALDALAVSDYKIWPRVINDVPAVNWIDTGSQHVSDAHFQIKVSLTSGGGTAGPMNHITVMDTSSDKSLETTFVSKGIRVLENFHGWPQFETWSRIGHGDYLRSLVRVEKGSYAEVRCDEFYFNAHEATRKDITAQIPGSTDLLYFMGTTDPRK
jgi:hypothetical protein